MSSELSVSETTLLRRPESVNSEDVSSSTLLVPSSPTNNTLSANNRNSYFVNKQPVTASLRKFIGSNSNIQVQIENNSINPTNINQQQKQKQSDTDTTTINMETTNKRVLFRVAIDVLILLCVGFPILFFHLWGDPYKRGFFCDDESLKHPFKESTVKNWMLYFIGIVLPVGMILILEIIQSRNSTRDANSNTSSIRYVFFDFKIPDWFVECYKKIGIFAFGAAVNQLATDIAKYSIGRLRPHFFNVCQPVLLDGTNCTYPANFGKYITEFTCKDTGSSRRMLKEMRLSFPSGHSSFTFYTMVYTALYLQSSLTWRGSKLFRHFMQFLLIMIAWYTALSRISDYKHHWSDVLAGATLGSLCAVIVANYVSDMFEKKKLSPLVLPTTSHDLQPQTIALNGH